MDTEKQNEMVTAKAQNIISLLEVEHRQVEQLFVAAEKTDHTNTYKCFNQVYEVLSLHTRAEEQVLYSAMQEYEATKKYVEEAEKEHKEAKVLLEEIKELKPSDGEFKTKIGELKKSVQQHIKKEENEIFDAILQCINEDKLTELGQDFQKAKVQLEADVKLAMAE